ncbi:MAG: TonB-dependent receptor, partial [Acidobacteriaceae bacterium]|nr:TonB-dependent receptor [Acidobacteriaceae bacterium]
SCTSGGPCDLSDYLSIGQIYKPNSLNDTSNTGRTPYPNNVIPASDLSAPAVNFFKLLPKPNVPGNALINNYAASGFGIFNTNQWDVRGDTKLSEKLHLFGRYTYFGGDLSGDPYFGAAGGLGFGAGGFAGTDSFRNQSIAGGGDYVVSSRWVTDFRFGYYRIRNETEGPNFDQPLCNNLGIPNCNGTPLSLYGGLPQINISIPSNGANNGQNIEYGTSANPNLQKEAQYQFVNNWSHQMGNHNIRFGADYRYGKLYTVSIASNALRSGTFFFSGPRTSGVSATGVASPGVGFATFLLGDSTTFWRTQTANINAQTRQNRFFTYAQDQWRTTPKLTINYGLRWELYTPESLTAAGSGGLLNIDTGILHIAGYGSNGLNLNVKNNFKEFAPRIGIAYQVFPKTVFRGGFGIVYGQGWAGDTFGNVLASSFPTQIQQSVQPISSYGAVFNLTQGPPGYTFPPIPADGNYPLPDGIYQIARPFKVRLPTVAGWNLMVQQELTPTMSVQVGYVGSHSYHNMFESSPSFNANEATLAGFDQINPTTGQPYTVPEREPYYDGTAQSQLGVRYGVPHGWTQRVDYMANLADNAYDALQIVVNKRFSSGLQFLTHYTWSHALGHESYEFLIDPRIGRGNGYYNRRHQFVFAGDYELPFGRDKLVGSSVPGWANQIIGGFQLNAALTIDGGIPFNTNYVSCALDNDIGANDNACFLNKVPGGSFGIHKGSYHADGRYVPYIKPSPYVLQPPGQPNNTFGAYARPAVATWGNIGRDALWGPGLINLDASLAKNFTLHENLRLQLIVQAFNALNHVNLANPDSCLDCQDLNSAGVQNAGTIQGTYSEQDGTSLRRLQFGARFQF